MNTGTADQVKLATRLVLEESSCSQIELARITAAGTYGPIDQPGAGCRLECGGQVVAIGKLVAKNGKTVFLVEETDKEAEHGDR